MRSRCTLHKTKLGEFQEFCESRGWTAEPPKGGYEVLRMRHSGRVDRLIVHDRDDATEHYTTWGESTNLFRAWAAANRKSTALGEKP